MSKKMSKKPKMTLTVGLPASGKSTVAAAIVSADPENTVQVERDQIRSALFGESYHFGDFPQKSEDQVTRLHQRISKEALGAGKNLVVSDTNLNPRFVHALARTARDYGAEIELKHFDVDPEECKRRNTARGDAGGRRVPDHVMDRMIKDAYDDTGHLKEMVIGLNSASFIPRVTPGMRLLEDFNKDLETENPIKGKAVVLVDVDGTLAANHHEANRAFGRPGEKKDFGYFFRAIEHAKVNEAVRDLGNKMRDNDDLNIIVLSGREDGYARELIAFVKRSGLKASRVICKRAGDGRSDFEYKKEVLDQLRDEGFALVHSIDDRERSVAVYEREGIMVSRVQEHTPEDPATAPKDYPEPRVNTIYGQGACIRCGALLKDSSRSIGPKCATRV